MADDWHLRCLLVGVLAKRCILQSCSTASYVVRRT